MSSESEKSDDSSSKSNSDEELNVDLVMLRIKQKMYRRVKVTGRSSPAYALMWHVYYESEHLEDWYSCISCGYAIKHKVSSGTGPLLRHYNFHLNQDGSGSSKSSQKKFTKQNVKNAVVEATKKPKSSPIKTASKEKGGSSRISKKNEKVGSSGSNIKKKSSPLFHFLKSEMVEILFRASRLGPVSKERIEDEMPGPSFW